MAQASVYAACTYQHAANMQPRQENVQKKIAGYEPCGARAAAEAGEGCVRRKSRLQSTGRHRTEQQQVEHTRKQAAAKLNKAGIVFGVEPTMSCSSLALKQR
jgi:hypothetical protein